MTLEALLAEVRSCQICVADLPLGPRPIIQAGLGARIMIIGQAPGAKVHAVGLPWRDASGDRLRQWLGVGEEQFYDPDKFALMPMGFCYPGRGNSGDLPPRRECAPHWHEQILRHLPAIKLTVLVGQYAQNRYLPSRPKRSMTEHVRRIEDAPRGTVALPHPSWRSTIWLRRNPWFEEEVLPTLRQRVERALCPRIPD